MAHLVSNTEITLDNNIKLDNMYCVYSPIFTNIKKGKILLDIKFYKDKASYISGFSRIYPLNPSTSSKSIITSAVKLLKDEEMNSPNIMNTNFLSEGVSSYLEKLYGFWNVKDDELEDIINVNINDSIPAFTQFKNKTPMNLYKIQIKKSNGTSQGIMNFNKASNSESIPLFYIDLSSGNIDGYYNSNGIVIKESTDYFTIFNADGFIPVKFIQGDTIDITFANNIDTSVNIKMKFRV